MPSSPDNKMKEEVFSNLAGINSKAGLYSNGPMEFQDMSNFDFQRPGALTQRWGSTLYQTQNFSGPISALYEYVKLDGSSYLLVGTSGALWSGATTGVAQGISFTFNGATYSYSPFIGTLTYTVALVESYGSVPIDGDSTTRFSQDGFTLPNFSIAPELQADNNLDFVVFQNYLFAADGNKFFKYDGLTTSPVGLPPASRGHTFGAGVTTMHVDSTFNWFSFYASYVNRRGFEGPAWLIGSVDPTIGQSNLSFSYYIHTPLQYDIASIKIYGYMGGHTASMNAVSASLWGLPYKLVTTATASGSTMTEVAIGYSGASLINTGAAPPDTSYLPLGFTLKTFTNSTDISEFSILPYYPRYLEMHQNRLFLAGFSLDPSTVWFSDVAEPEGYDPSFNIEVRTNDGDRITALKDYNSRLYIFKQFSFSELSGDNPDNFFEREVSDQYGCLSNRAVAVYNDIMLFLDSKGVMQFNGAGLKCISEKVQPIFDAMNITAAIDKATMVHDKQRNEILIGIPVNGATTNNMTVVYDYLCDCWTKYEGYSPAVYAPVKQRFSNKTAMFGDYSGKVMNFGQSLASDNAVGFTTYFKTGFHSDEGYTNTKLWRRLWTNVDEATGATVPCNINFFQDYGASVVLSRTTYLSPFQTRLDFGIPAKSIAFEFSKFSVTTMIRYYGHGFAFRHQRGV